MPRPTAKDIIALVDYTLAVFGADAFSDLGSYQLHSGPYAVILKELFGSSPALYEKAKAKKSNFARAAQQALRTPAIRLEDTRAGGTLDAQKIYAFFTKHYAPFYDLGRDEADKVWSYLSAKFIQALTGKVVTAVCGADKGRVFRAVELPELVLNSNIESVNGVPWQKIKDLYFSDPAHGPYKAFRLICVAELRMALHRARNEKTAEAIEDCYYRQTFYHIERRLTLTAAGKAVPAAYQKLSRAKRRADFAAFKATITARKTPSASAATPATAHGITHSGLHP